MAEDDAWTITKVFAVGLSGALSQSVFLIEWSSGQVSWAPLLLLAQDYQACIQVANTLLAASDIKIDGNAPTVYQCMQHFKIDPNAFLGSVDKKFEHVYDFDRAALISVRIPFKDQEKSIKTLKIECDKFSKLPAEKKKVAFVDQDERQRIAAYLKAENIRFTRKPKDLVNTPRHISDILGEPAAAGAAAAAAAEPAAPAKRKGESLPDKPDPVQLKHKLRLAEYGLSFMDKSKQPRGRPCVFFPFSSFFSNAAPGRSAGPRRCRQSKVPPRATRSRCARRQLL